MPRLAPTFSGTSFRSPALKRVLDDVVITGARGRTPSGPAMTPTDRRRAVSAAAAAGARQRTLLSLQHISNVADAQLPGVIKHNIEGCAPPADVTSSTLWNRVVRADATPAGIGRARLSEILDTSGASAHVSKIAGAVARGSSSRRRVGGRRVGGRRVGGSAGRRVGGSAGRRVGGRRVVRGRKPTEPSVRVLWQPTPTTATFRCAIRPSPIATRGAFRCAGIPTADV